MESRGNELKHSKCWKKKNVNQEFYIRQNYTSENQDKLRHIQINKNLEKCTSCVLKKKKERNVSMYVLGHFSHVQLFVTPWTI